MTQSGGDSYKDQACPSSICLCVLQSCGQLWVYSWLERGKDEATTAAEQNGTQASMSQYACGGDAAGC